MPLQTYPLPWSAHAPFWLRYGWHSFLQLQAVLHSNVTEAGEPLAGAAKLLRTAHLTFPIRHRLTFQGSLVAVLLS